MRAVKTRESHKGSGIGTLTKALLPLLKSSANAAFIAGLFAVSGCTPTSGPDIAVATYGISTPAPQGLTLESTAPDQAPAVVVGATPASPANLADPLDVAGVQAFVPGSSPPSAVLPVELASATTINANAGAEANSGTYVTDGVEKTIPAPASSEPLTPSDVAGQVPVPGPIAADTQKKQVAVLDVEPSTAVATTPQPDPVVTEKSPRASKQAKPTLFGSLFASKPKKAQQSLTASPVEGDVQLASLETPQDNAGQQTEAMSSLPGVNSKNLFGLDPASADGEFEEEPQVQVASATAAGLARLAPNGILKQTDRVEVGCFKPELVSVLKKIENHYGKKVVVTSGYRSPQGNRRAGGSRHSLHMMCAAADIQMSGVGKWELAKYMRTMPGRGGVGTYCYTDSVHIDVGSQRDWNWRCRRR